MDKLPKKPTSCPKGGKKANLFPRTSLSPLLPALPNGAASTWKSLCVGEKGNFLNVIVFIKIAKMPLLPAKYYN